MKINVFFILVLLMNLFSCSPPEIVELDCLPTHLQPGVIAFYPFNNGNLSDESINSNDLNNTTQAFSCVDRDGNLNCAYQFDNNSKSTPNFLTTKNSNFLDNLEVFSISLWYQPLDSLRGDGDFELLFARRSSVKKPFQRVLSLALYDCRRAVFSHNNSVWANMVTNGSDCHKEVVTLTDKWHHVIAVKNNDNYKIYFDGQLHQSKSGNSNSSNFQVVKDLGDVFVGLNYNGQLDDVIIYNRALSQGDVLDLFVLNACCK